MAKTITRTTMITKVAVVSVPVVIGSSDGIIIIVVFVAIMVVIVIINIVTMKIV